MEYQELGEFYEIGLAQGMPLESIPEKFRNDPLPDYLIDHTFMKAFWELTTERSIGMAVGPIPVSQIRAYAEDRGLGIGMIEGFTTVIRKMDSAYIKYLDEKMKKDAKQNGRFQDPGNSRPETS